MNIKQISLAWIAVSDIKKSRDFFAQTLGLELMQDGSDTYGWLELAGSNGGNILGVGQAQDESNLPKEQHSPIKPGQNAVLTFLVDDIAAARAELEAKGVSFVGEIFEIPDHVRITTFHDLDGNCFQLIEKIGE